VIPRERFGLPQLLALALLFLFLAQCMWVIHRRPLMRAEVLFARAGLERFHRHSVESPAMPAPAAIAAAPLLLSPHDPESLIPEVLKWTLRLPFAAFAWVLGASIWYVARRLYGNLGGYLALALYCFSPVVYFVIPGPLITGALGMFGTVFVSIAAAHTLYAPPRDANASAARAAFLELKHRWRRILLLGFSMALAVGSGYASVLTLPIAIALMIYLIPERAAAAIAIFLAGCVVAILALLAIHGFSLHGMAVTFAHARIFPSDAGFTAGDIVRSYWYSLGRNASPLLLLVSLLALATYMAIPRSRYFGNTAPLLIALLVLPLSLFTLSDVFVGPFPLRSLPFLFVFIGGIFADLVETRLRRSVLITTGILLFLYAATGLVVLLRLPDGVLR
jgi:hypothetical protein